MVYLHIPRKIQFGTVVSCDMGYGSLEANLTRHHLYTDYGKAPLTRSEAAESHFAAHALVSVCWDKSIAEGEAVCRWVGSITTCHCTSCWHWALETFIGEPVELAVGVCT